MLEGKGFASSGHRNCVDAKARKIQVLAQPAPENRQRARAARLITVNGRERVPKVFAAAGLDLNENQFVLGVNGDQVELPANLFVFQSSGRSPVPLQNPVAVVCWVRFGLRRGLLFGLLSWVSPPVDSGSASTVPAARVPERG